MCESRAIVAAVAADEALALVPETGALGASLAPFVSASFDTASLFANETLRIPRAFEFALERFALDLNSAPRIGAIYS